LIIHVVRSGETLWQLANRYNVNMNSIIQYNELANPNQLLIGQSLVIPTSGTSHLIRSEKRYGQFHNNMVLRSSRLFKLTR
jgi:cortical fragment-lytic enzyme